ncbi:MAG TPA: NADPH:quinone oxidoreductase family protein [Burkholderiaceae bacterium]|nr:NADPH:quinone oxidoreductase family protein [Burkholderiaceae bacterium]
MRAVVCRSFDGIEALEWGELADPAPGAGEVLIDVHAAALSFMDTLMVAGRYQMKPALPFVPGTDAAGVVLAIGDGVQRVGAGDRVACTHWHGGMAERMVAPERSVVKLPDGVGFEIGSTVRYAYGTAHYALELRAQLRAGETVFVSGAAGGLGMAAVDLARQMGATVIAGTSSAAKGEVARKQGAADAIDYSREPVRDRLLELTQGRGVDVYFDTVGGSLFGAVSRAMAWGGRMLPIGFTSGDIPSLAMNLPLLKNTSVVGCYWGAWVEREPEQSRAADERLFAAVAQGLLRPQVSDVLSMSSFADGLQRLARRQVTGRVVLRAKRNAEALA